MDRTITPPGMPLLSYIACDVTWMIMFFSGRVRTFPRDARLEFGFAKSETRRNVSEKLR